MVRHAAEEYLHIGCLRAAGSLYNSIRTVLEDHGWAMCEDATFYFWVHSEFHGVHTMEAAYRAQVTRELEEK